MKLKENNLLNWHYFKGELLIQIDWIKKIKIAPKCEIKLVLSVAIFYNIVENGLDDTVHATA